MAGFDGRDGFAHAIKSRDLTKETSMDFIKRLIPDEKWKKRSFKWLDREFKDLFYSDSNINGNVFRDFVNFCIEYLRDNRFQKNFNIFFEALLDTYNSEDPVLSYVILDGVLKHALGYKCVDKIIQEFS